MFELHAGETAAFVLEEAAPGMPSPSAAPDYTSRVFKDTVNFWRTWIGRSQYEGRWREMVNRSALALKLIVLADARLARGGRHVRPPRGHRR